MSEKANNESSSPSKILLEECFLSEDNRFVDELKKFQSPKFLVTIIPKWLEDSRPWAREQIVRYLEGNLNLPGHEVVLKRIFKHFLEANDHEMMGVLMVVLDRMVRRTRYKVWRYDRDTRQYWREERLVAKPNKTVVDETGRFTEVVRGRKKYKYPIPDLVNKQNNVLFSNKTRNHLRRAAWRHFRFLSYRQPGAFVVNVGQALARYTDADFYLGENIIDNWSLMHACYYHHDAISFTAAHTNLVEGQSLANLNPKPYQPSAWTTETGRDVLIELLINAQSALVRLWAIELFRREHESSFDRIELSTMLRLLASPDPRLQEFAGQIFENHPTLSTLTVDQWLNLINDSSVGLLPLICNAMKKHVSLERLDNGQLVELTNAQQVPVAALGFELLQSRDLLNPLSVDELIRLSECKCASQVEKTTQWAIGRICNRGPYQTDFVVDFFDALLRLTRNAAMAWLRDSESDGYNDAHLWAKLIESPFDDVKIELVELLNHRHAHPGGESDQLTPVWISVILGVHRGGRTKPKAIDQLTHEIERHSGKADSLLPVLAVALRSVRTPEKRNALAALVWLAKSSPELQSKIETTLPELEFVSTEVAS